MKARKTGIALAALLLLAATAGTVFAGAEGRVMGTVVDENGKPLPEVTITVTAEAKAFEEIKKTNKKGKFTLMFVDATIPYKITLEKEGHHRYEDVLRPQVGETQRPEFVLPTATAQAQPTAATVDTTGTGDRAIDAFNEGVNAYKTQDFATAETKFREAIDHAPKLAEAHSALASVLSDQGKHEEALVAVDQFLELSPGNIQGLQVRYDAYKALGKEEEAAYALEELTKAAGGGAEAAPRFFNLGAEAARLGKLDDAKRHFEKALELNPELAPAYYALARIHLGLGNLEEAARYADEAYARQPEHDETLKVRYEVYQRSGDETKAQEALQALAAKDPKGTAQSIFNEGVDHFNNNEMDAAKESFEQALALDSSNAKVHYMLGLCYINQGDIAQGKEHLQHFVEMASEGDPDKAVAQEMIQSLG